MDAIGVIEVNSIATGFEISDTMVKTAAVKLIEALPMCPGKFIILVGGEVADVNSAVAAGVKIAPENIIESTVIPKIHPDVFKAINAVTQIDNLEAIGIIETFNVTAGIIAADAAIKAAFIELVEIRLSRGQGGKSFFIVTGTVGAVKAAIDAGVFSIQESGSLFKYVVIPSPHPELLNFLY